MWLIHMLMRTALVSHLTRVLSAIDTSSSNACLSAHAFSDLKPLQLVTMRESSTLMTARHDLREHTIVRKTKAMCSTHVIAMN
jgi:hypothetical protein